MDKTEKKIIRTRLYGAPCGVLVIGALDGQLCLCDWLVERHHERVVSRLAKTLHAQIEEGASEVTEEAARQLDEYFAGRRREFSVPLLFVGTAFQKAVWCDLLRIPYGQTISYGEMAQRIGRPTSVRAVANANGANALSVFAPCHRVIGSDHTLTGYGGGLNAKRWLLALEGIEL